VQAPELLADQGEIAAELALPWVRTARDALALAEAALARRARPRWVISLSLAPDPDAETLLPGDSLTLADPWSPEGAALITRVETDRTGALRLTAERPAGRAPRIELLGTSTLIDAARADPIAVSYRDGVATFTILTDLGDPLASASVTLDGSQTRTTDRSGQVQFTTERGLHSLLVTANGYAPLEMDVVI